MALPQTVDPTSLNLSGKPAIATAPTTTVTTPASPGMPAPRVEDVPHEVSPLLGGLFSGLLAYASANRGNKAGTGTGTGTGAGTGTGTGGNIGSTIGNIIKNITGGSGSGNIGSVNNVVVPAGIPASEAQAWLNAQYGTTNGEPNYVVSGTNMSTGQAVGTINTNIGPNWSGNTSTQGSTGAGTNTGTGTTPTDTLTNIGGGYFTDDNSNVYDSNGNLIYQNPSATTGTQTEPSGGGWDPALDQYYQNSYGDVYDGLGNLVLSFNNGYYYEPDTGNFYDSSFDPVSTDFNAYTDYFNIPTFDSSGTDLGNIDWSGYGTDWTTTWVKDGGSINKGGLPTPLFKKGGNVKHFADGGTSFTDQVVANQVPVTTAANTSTSTGGGSSGNILDSILNFATSNPTLTGAGLGALLTAALNQNTSIPTNKGVDMTALGTLKPRTTTVGPARYVPYSEYGTPTTPADYSTLYQNLGVSPFNTPAPATAPTAPATTPTMPATAPAGGLPTAPTTPTGATPVAPSMPSYFSDADGNIYDANGDLVYDVTSGSMTASTGATVTPTSSTPTAPSTTGTLAPTGAGDAYYSYGTPVTPSSVLGAKKGGLAVKKMADGGMSDLAVTSLSDFVEAPVFDYSDRKFSPMGGVKYDATTGLATDINGNTMDVGTFVTTYGTHPSNFTPDFYPKDNTALETFYSSMSSIDPSQYDNYFAPEATYNLGNYGDITGQQIQDYFTMRNNEMPVYNQGMPTQGPAMPTQGPLMPTQGGLMPQQGSAMPTQGPAMPQQTPFSASPTFRFSGENNPLLAGLRQGMPGQQPFMLNPAGQFVAREEISTPRTYGGYAEGGDIGPNIPYHVNANIPNLINGRHDYRQGSYVQGPGDGQSDDIPAMLADGEYVIDAETVAQLGNGSNKAGAKMLDEFRENIRAHKRSAPTHKIPPKSKSALAYLKGAK